MGQSQRGCMNTANVLRLMPALSSAVGATTQCGVARSSPPEWTCEVEAGACRRGEAMPPWSVGGARTSAAARCPLAPFHALACIASPTWKARWSGGMATCTVCPALSRTYSPARRSGQATCAPSPSRYIALHRPVRLP